MNKLEMAHDYVMNYLSNPSCENATVSSIVSVAWSYVDAMQAEADKRGTRRDEKIEINMYPEWDASINYPPDAWVVYRGEKRLAVSIKDEWQPDWSQAPEWANWWAMDKSGQGVWHNLKPSRDQSVVEWVIDFSSGSDFSYKVSLDFNYQGDWRDSLRKRPQ